MKRTFFLAAALSIALPSAIALAATAQSNLAITVTSPSSQGGGGGSSLLPADRNASANWQMAGLLSVGGIPNRTTQCGTTINPRGGGQDDTANIQAAIDACPAGQVVQLAAGTFTIAEGSYILLNKSITLRGAGPGPGNNAKSTLLTRPTGKSCSSSQPAGVGATMDCAYGGQSPSEMLHISPVGRFVGNNTTACALTSDAAQGSYTISVSSSCISQFAPGQQVVLDEVSGAQWMPDPENSSGIQIWAASDYRVTYHLHNPSQSGDDSSDVSCYYVLTCDRVTNEIKQVASVDTTHDTVTFDSPVMISYRVSHSADLWSFQTPFLQEAGVEDLTTQYADNGGVEMDFCAYCWLYRVQVENYIGQGIHMDTDFRPQLEEFEVNDAAWPSPGGAGYNIDLIYDTSEALIENGISIRANKVMVARGSGAGSVIAYNYVDDGYDIGSDGWQEIGLNASHLVGPHHVLFEGNRTFNMDSDATHGASIYMTYFRNDSTAVRSPFTGLDGVAVNDSANGCTGGGPLRAAGAQAFSYWFSFIGNVLGTPNCTTSANSFPLNGCYGCTDGSNGIFMLGWWNIGLSINDPTTATVYPNTPPGVNGTTSSCTTSGTNCATIVDGNYDYLRNQITWASNDTAHTLPNSFYLSSEPSFFKDGASCTYTWPWVDPTGSTVVYTNSCGGSGLPAKARYDAGTPFTQP